MTTDAKFSSDVAFTPSVKGIQARKGSRRLYERVEKHGSWQAFITPNLKAFVEEQRSVFLATASKDGQPTIQHRGGPAGFLRVLDQSTIAFVDYVGNRQYITLGNLSENPRASLFLIDYAHRSSLKRMTDVGAATPARRAPSSKPVPVAFMDSLKEARWTSESGTLLELAEARGLSPEFSCRAGTCGTCKTKLLAGAVTYLNEPTAEVADDEVLICFAVPAEQAGDGEDRIQLAL
jgi:predicted pyridoxine 5'-phosphate oxidase superfamily flavin-nucleotide-binding protein